MPAKDDKERGPGYAIEVCPRPPDEAQEKCSCHGHRKSRVACAADVTFDVSKLILKGTLGKQGNEIDSSQCRQKFDKYR